jgi:tetratricopeptide (TPR) repeat protein
MAVFELRPSLTAEERAEKRTLILRDSIALLSLFLITVALAVLTYFLFGSFSRHRDVLARRWRANGERALRNGHPKEAIAALHAALEYAPGQRSIEIELAMALAASGQDLEATAYFNSLLETQPGNGLIHVQLARLAAKQGNATLAEEHYQRALDGTWEGNGYLMRLSVRLELANYLISRKDFSKAQMELRTAAGNAPKTAETQLNIAALMEQAQDPADAYEIYDAQMHEKGAPLEAYEGAGRTAFAMGRIEDARDALARAVEYSGFGASSESAQKNVRQMLADSIRILDLYPSPELSVRARAERVMHAVKIARARLNECFADTNSAGELADLQGQWQQIPTNLTLNEMEQNPQTEQTSMRIVYATEEETAQLCGPPTGDDALLLKLAQAPLAVQQP